MSPNCRRRLRTSSSQQICQPATRRGLLRTYKPKTHFCSASRWLGQGLISFGQPTPGCRFRPNDMMCPPKNGITLIFAVQCNRAELCTRRSGLGFAPLASHAVPSPAAPDFRRSSFASWLECAVAPKLSRIPLPAPASRHDGAIWHGQPGLACAQSSFGAEVHVVRPFRPFASHYDLSVGGIRSVLTISLWRGLGLRRRV